MVQILNVMLESVTKYTVNIKGVKTEYNCFGKETLLDFLKHVMPCDCEIKCENVNISC